MKLVKNILAIIGVIAIFASVGFIVWFIAEIFRDDTPQFFAFNDQEAEYVIVKELWPEEIFLVKYKGSNALNVLTPDSQGFITIMVGETKYDLNEFIGKKVILKKGSFKSGFTKQCVNNKCVPIGGPYAAVVIDEMSEVK